MEGMSEDFQILTTQRSPQAASTVLNINPDFPARFARLICTKTQGFIMEFPQMDVFSRRASRAGNRGGGGVKEVRVGVGLDFRTCCSQEKWWSVRAQVPSFKFQLSSFRFQVSSFEHGNPVPESGGP